MNTTKSSKGPDLEVFKLTVRREGAVLFAEIAAPTMNLLGQEFVRDLVSLIQRTEADQTLQVFVVVQER
jgi:enoyl-CoA hydratase/carnithine racemase